MKETIFYSDEFSQRHNSISDDDQKKMLSEIGVKSIDELINLTIPDSIRLKSELNLDPAQTETQFLKSFKNLVGKNKQCKSYIGMGYYDCITPNVIKRNILENPGWYTAYTPYQAEIAQGRLEALINYQTVVSDLTGMQLSNASLLDEGTAASEAMTMFYRLRKGEKKSANKFFVSEKTFPQTIELIKTRAAPLGIEVIIGKIENFDFSSNYFGILIQYPDSDGNTCDLSAYIKKANNKSIFACVCSDLMSLAIFKSPGEMGADVVVGNSQRFGVPMGYGGPHAAFFATREEFKRHIPGRIIGVSVDSSGNNAYRMALQTREQHIKRDRATSNISTAQVLLAVMAGMYAVYHGPTGIRRIAERIHALTQLLCAGLKQLGYSIIDGQFFDTISVNLGSVTLDSLLSVATQKKVNLRVFNADCVRVSLDDTTSVEDVQNLLQVFCLEFHPFSYLHTQ